jgi:serine protease inhibitor
MNALEKNLESRVPQAFASGDNPGEVTVRIANAAYLQKGYPFEPAYLQTVGSNYGPVLNEVDFRRLVG